MNFFIKIICVCLWITLATGAGPDNRGTEFIIGYMENNGLTFDVELFVTTMRTTVVNVEVTAPRFSGFTVSESFSVTAGQVKQLFFGPSIRMAGSALDSKAILITSDDEVVMYGVNKETYSNDAYLALPTDVLGKEYYAFTWYPPSKQCELMVIGINDTTTVSIKLPSAIGGNTVTFGGTTYGAGDTITQVIQRFDTMQIVSLGDLTGAYVTADKIIAVQSGNKKTRVGAGGSSDHLTEFLVPVDNWGKNFITVPIPMRTVGDYFKIIASEDQTTVNITGGYTETFTISEKGEMVERLIDSTSYCSITADKAISIVQIVQSQQSSSEPSDPAMMIIPPIEQYGADYTFSTPKYSQGSYNNYFMFVVKNADKDGLKLDGVALSGVTYHDIANTGYVGGYVSVTDGTHTMRHDSPIKIFGGYLYGQARYETYAFPTGMRLAPINTVCVPTVTTIGDGLDNDCDGLIDEELCTASNAGADDDGDGQSDEDCATPPPVDGNWAAWSSLSSCSITCTSTTGGPTTGVSFRDRTCTDPAPAYDGKQCVGASNETTSCTVNVNCPVNGEWSDWASWGSCTVTCGSGRQSRTRTCTNPAPQYGGDDCVGDTAEYKNGCNPSACPTASANNYVQVCGTGWFTCLSGTINCIEEAFKCDCNSDCDDNSDELDSYASCGATHAATCAARTGNNAGALSTPLLLLIVTACVALFKNIQN